MEKLNRLLCWSLFGVIFLTSCYLSFGNRNSESRTVVKTSGVVVKKNIVVPDYKSIDVSNGIHLILTDGDKNNVSVEADEAYHQYVDIHVAGNVLNIRMKPMKSNYGMKTIKVSASARGVSKYYISSAASVTAQTTLVGSELAFDLSSAADFTGEIACKKVTVDASSAAELELSGTTDFFGIDISSAATVNAGKLRAKKVVCDVSSASSARVYASEELTVDASSAGSVNYSGDAKVVRIETSSGASVSRK